MSTSISNKLKQLIDEIIVDNGLLVNSVQCKYRNGSENGDGFMSDNLAVDILNGNKSLYLFCKSNTNTNPSITLEVEKMYENEIYFYKTIYPAYQDFLRKKGVEDGFRNVAKCYGVDKDIIVLDNLKRQGFDLFNKTNCMDDQHIVLTMKTIAKYHAISFAFKDQNKDLFNDFMANVRSCFTDMMVKAGYDIILSAETRLFLKSLDPVTDAHLLEKCKDLVEILNEVILNVEEYSCKCPIIIHGDSWCNNTLYLYDEKSQENPADIMLIDWQVLRSGSPAFDLAYFFYSVASETTLKNLDYYLQGYYEELLTMVTRLGTDLEAQYSFSDLKEEWKKFAKYALAEGFFVTKVLTADKEDLLNLIGYDEIIDKFKKVGGNIENMIPRLKKEHLFYARMKLFVKHFIENDFL